MRCIVLSSPHIAVNIKLTTVYGYYVAYAFVVYGIIFAHAYRRSYAMRLKSDFARALRPTTIVVYTEPFATFAKLESILIVLLGNFSIKTVHCCCDRAIYRCVCVCV